VLREQLGIEQGQQVIHRHFGSISVTRGYREEKEIDFIHPKRCHLKICFQRLQ